MGRTYLFGLCLLAYTSNLASPHSLTTSESAALRICGQSQNNANLKNWVTIPSHFMSTHQTTIFKASPLNLECKSGVDGIKSSVKFPLTIRPSGYVSILSSEWEGIFYNTNQYCIWGISEAELQIQTCKRVCTEREPCINKCCPPDKIYKPQISEDDEWCVDPGKIKYTPRIFTSSSKEISGQINPWYHWRPPQIWRSECLSLHFYAFGKEAAKAIGEDNNFRHRIRSDGEKVYWNSYARHWELMEKTEKYCMDGILYEPGQIYQNKEKEYFMLFCHNEDEPTKEKKVDLSFYYGILYISSSPFALITVTVYALLWEKQNIHGWTIMSYCTAVFFWFVLSGVASLTKTEVSQKSTLCTLAATMAHFFVIATFCWLALISFDLWNTFRTLTVSKGKGIKKFMYYSLFGWGLPLIMVCFSWSMEWTYGSDEDCEVNTPRYGAGICYISKYALGLYVFLPFGILMLANIILFSMTSWKLIQTKRSIRFATENLKKDRNSYSLFFKLFLVTGILWIFEIVSWLVDKKDVKWYWAILDSLNGISPVCVFVIFICKRDIIKSLNSKYSFLKCTPFLSFFNRNSGTDSPEVQATKSTTVKSDETFGSQSNELSKN